jgi:hypothetical protein
MHRMVAADLIVWHTLVLTGVLFVKKLIVDHVTKRSEVKMSKAVFLSALFGGL